MIKHRELVFRMSLEEKIRLVTSVKAGENCPVDNYRFPTFKLSARPAEFSAGNYATVFPSDKALASTWNASLVRDIYSCIGNEAKVNVPNAYFNTFGDIGKAAISEDYYFTAEFVASKIRGLNACGAPVNFDTVSGCSDRVLKECVKRVTDKAMDVKPHSVLVGSVEEAEKLPVQYKYEGTLYGVASTKEEAVKYLYYGCSLVFLESDFTDELAVYISGLTEQFIQSRLQYETGKITLAEFDRRARNGEILDIGIINSACDSFIDTLLKLKENNPASVSEKRTVLGNPHIAKFNEVLHDNMAYGGALQSIVLLKNRGGALPLEKHTRIAVIGEYAKNQEYYTDFTNDIPTAVRLPFEVINGYEINAAGYAHGYLRGESGRNDLLETACGLCKDVDYALVYLNCERGETALPKGQTELIDALVLKGVKIIAVVSADGVIDTEFTEKCEAVLFNYRSGQAEATAVFDIITGKVCPSGKLVDTFPRNLSADGYGELPAYGSLEAADIRYPFGYGLSYTQFEYGNLKITENGASCVVTNKGGMDGFVTVQLYVKKEPSATTLSQKTLRGFAKVFLKSNDSALVEIPFDGNTFRTYDPANNKFMIEGGTYSIYVGDNACAVRLGGELTLEQHIFNNGAVTNEKVQTDETMPVGFTAGSADKAIRKEKVGLSFGLKLTLAILLMVYYNGIGALIIVSNFLNSGYLVLYIVMGLLLAIGDALAIAYIVVISKKRKLQKYLHPNDVLSDMVEKVAVFNEIAKVNYVESVPEPEQFVQEENVEEEEEQPEIIEEVEEVKAKTYENTFESGEEETVFANQVSFGELCANFREYALSRGVAVEPSSVRALMASVSSSKLVLLSCRNTDVLPALLDAISGYFGGVCVTADDGWQTPDDLLWKQEADRYLPSEFANAVNGACGSPDKNCVAILNNVNFGNIKSYFSDFIGYSLFPSEAHTLALNEELSLRLPDNMCYILVSANDRAPENMPAELAHAALQIEILATAAAATEEVEIKNVSRGNLAELVSEAREKHYLSEKIWKKIDELVEAVCATERFAIGNKNILCIEKYSAVLFECGGDEGEVFTGTFTAKIVPLLKTLKLYGKENGANTIYGIVEKLFADEDLSKIKKALLGT